MPERLVDTTDAYKKSTRKLRGFREVESAVRILMRDFGFNVTARSKRIHVSQDNQVEIWELRIPKKGGGASSGFRMFVIRIIKTDTVFLDYVWDRKDLNKAKVMSEYQTHLNQLKQNLCDYE